MRKTAIALLGIAVIISLTGCQKRETSNNIPDEKEIITTESEDVISGNKWMGKDGSLLKLNADITYTWYQRPTVTNDNYYSGTYEVYRGQEAVDYISTNLAEYGVTEYEQEMLFLTTDNDMRKENYYCIVLQIDRMIINGNEEEIVNEMVPYLGFYYNDAKYLDLANMSTQNNAGFKLVENENM